MVLAIAGLGSSAAVAAREALLVLVVGLVVLLLAALVVVALVLFWSGDAPSRRLRKLLRTVLPATPRRPE